VPNRPCKPDADLRWIWQTLLPDTPFPTCGAAQDADTAKSPANERVDAAPPDAEEFDPSSQNRG
jgi:hypothetical protein